MMLGMDDGEENLNSRGSLSVSWGKLIDWLISWFIFGLDTYPLCHPSAADGPQEFERRWCSLRRQIFLTKGKAVDRTKLFMIEAKFMIYMNSNCCKKVIKNTLHFECSFWFLHMCLEETLCTHAKLLGYIVFPDQALYLCKKFFTWHEIRTVGQKKKNNCSCCIHCVNRCLRVVDSCLI